MKFQDSMYLRLTSLGHVAVPVFGGSLMTALSRLGNWPNAASFKPWRKVVTGTNALETPLNVPLGIAQLLMFGYAFRKSMNAWGSAEIPNPLRMTVSSVTR